MLIEPHCDLTPINMGRDMCPMCGSLGCENQHDMEGGQTLYQCNICHYCGPTPNSPQVSELSYEDSDPENVYSYRRQHCDQYYFPKPPKPKPTFRSVYDYQVANGLQMTHEEIIDKLDEELGRHQAEVIRRREEELKLLHEEEERNAKNPRPPPGCEDWAFVDGWFVRPTHP